MVSTKQKRTAIQKCMGKGGSRIQNMARSVAQGAGTGIAAGARPGMLADGNTAMSALKGGNPVLAGARAIGAGGNWLDNNVASPIANGIRGLLKKNK